MHISPFWRWSMGLTIALLVFAVPVVHYRQSYLYAKRLRVVTEGKVYRSGCLTADGLSQVIRKYKIKTVVNLQELAPDPDLPNHYFSFKTTPESEVCRRQGARMVYMPIQLVDDRQVGIKTPETIGAFMKLMDEVENYPVLIHCRAGLHRAGTLVALYRQEYEGWSHEDALRELKNHGFGEFVSTKANPYIAQYIHAYQPRWAAAGQATGKHGWRPGDPPFQGVSFSPLPSAQPTKPAARP